MGRRREGGVQVVVELLLQVGKELPVFSLGERKTEVYLFEHRALSLMAGPS